MDSTPRAPHFLRVTQALALVSGLGTCFAGAGAVIVGCSGDQCGRYGSCFSPEMGDAAKDQGSPYDLSLDASRLADVLNGIGVAPEDSGGGEASVEASVDASLDASPSDVGTNDGFFVTGVGVPPHASTP